MREVEIYRINKRTGYRCGRNEIGDLFLGKDSYMEYFKYTDEMKAWVISQWEFNNKFE